MKKKLPALGFLIIAFLTGCVKEINPINNSSSELSTLSENSTNQLTDAFFEQQPGGEYVPNEVLVKFKKGTTPSGRANALAKISGNVKEHIRTKVMERFDDEGVYLIHMPLAVLDAISKAKGREEIEYAVPNYIYTYGAVSNDPFYGNGTLWGMYGDATFPANQYGSQAGEAWANGHTGNISVHVGVIDEGIQFTHPDLDANIWTNPYDRLDGVDNDNNGYVDDIHGWDFANNDNSIYDGGNSGKLDKHGTHVSGTIGAEGGNSTGDAGVNWQVTIISAKFLGRNGGTTANAIKAVDYLTDLKTRHGIDLVATNNSWGGGGFSQPLLDAITRGARANILFIAAAGNGGNDGVGDNNDAAGYYPSNYNTTAGAGYDAVISVAALNSNGTKASFSNYGQTTVDLGAPGSGIHSTLPLNKYGSYSGTSMATPHVTGGAALYAATHGERGPALKAVILNSTISTTSLVGRTVTNGRLNVSGF